MSDKHSAGVNDLAAWLRDLLESSGDDPQRMEVYRVEHVGAKIERGSLIYRRELSRGGGKDQIKGIAAGAFVAAQHDATAIGVTMLYQAVCCDRKAQDVTRLLGLISPVVKPGTPI